MDIFGAAVAALLFVVFLYAVYVAYKRFSNEEARSGSTAYTVV